MAMEASIFMLCCVLCITLLLYTESFSKREKTFPFVCHADRFQGQGNAVPPRSKSGQQR